MAFLRNQHLTNLKMMFSTFFLSKHINSRAYLKIYLILVLDSLWAYHLAQGNQLSIILGIYLYTWRHMSLGKHLCIILHIFYIG